MITKKTVAKNPLKAVKKVASKRVTQKTAPMQSFRVYKDTQPFIQPRLSRQTLYWIILLAFIILTQLWILSIQMDIANLTTLIMAE